MTLLVFSWFPFFTLWILLFSFLLLFFFFFSLSPFQENLSPTVCWRILILACCPLKASSLPGISFFSGTLLSLSLRMCVWICRDCGDLHLWLWVKVWECEAVGFLRSGCGVFVNFLASFSVWVASIRFCHWNLEVDFSFHESHFWVSNCQFIFSFFLSLLFSVFCFFGWWIGILFSNRFCCIRISRLKSVRSRDCIWEIEFC